MITPGLWPPSLLRRLVAKWRRWRSFDWDRCPLDDDLPKSRRRW